MVTLLDVLGAPFGTVLQLDFEYTDALAQFSGGGLARSECLEELYS